METRVCPGALRVSKRRAQDGPAGINPGDLLTGPTRNWLGGP